MFYSDNEYDKRETRLGTDFFKPFHSKFSDLKDNSLSDCCVICGHLWLMLSECTGWYLEYLELEASG